MIRNNKLCINAINVIYLWWTKHSWLLFLFCTFV